MSNNTVRIERNLLIIKEKRKELSDWNKSINPDEVYRITIELLNWVVNSNEWFYTNYHSKYVKLRNEDDKARGIIRGLKQAYNSFKHNLDIISVEGRKYIDFLKADKINYVIEQIVWVRYHEIKSNDDRKLLVDGYKYYLESNSVIETFDIAISFLNKCFREILKS